MTNQIFQSATRVALLALICVLCIVTLYATVKFQDKQFEIVFTAFIQVVTNVASFFFGKSSTEQQAASATTTDPLVEALKQ